MSKVENLLTEKQLADRLNVSRRTVQDWRYRGGGPPYIKMGSAVRYQESAVAEWLGAREYSSTTDAAQQGGRR